MVIKEINTNFNIIIHVFNLKRLFISDVIRSYAYYGFKWHLEFSKVEGDNCNRSITEEL